MILTNENDSHINHSKQALMRVIPIEDTITHLPSKTPDEQISHIIESARLIALGSCRCRAASIQKGEGSGDMAEDMCIYFDESAQEYINKGEFHEISKEEAYELIKRAEENGFMHQIPATSAPDAVKSLCSCGSGTCMSLRMAQQYDAYQLVRSNYVARVNADSCVACGLCVEYCPVNAVRLGQKLCIAEKPDRAEQCEKPVSFYKKSSMKLNYLTSRTDVTADGSSPCKAECPAHISVQGYLKLAGEGRYRDALELIKRNNPFPSVCGRICNKACESACSRGQIDESVAIDDVKKAVAQLELDPSSRFIPQKLNQYGRAFKEKIAVIGAGPAGLSCAYYLAAMDYPVTVFEKSDKLGGMLVHGIPKFRLSRDVVAAEIDVLAKLGVEFATNTELGKDITLQQLRAQGYKAFFLAIGAQKSGKIGCEIPGMAGVYGALDFLRLVNNDEKPSIGESVAVIGGGNVALDAARTAVRMGAKTVSVLYRRTRDEMPASAEEIKEAEEEGVTFRFLVSPAELLGKDKLEGIRLELMTLGEQDEKGRRKPVGSGTYEIVEADTLIAATGQVIDWGKLLDNTAVKLNKNRTAVADLLTCQSDEKDIFIGGDALTGTKFAITAIAGGKQAALSIHRYVHEGHSLVNARDPNDYAALDKGRLLAKIPAYAQIPRQCATAEKAVDYSNAFSDPRGVLTREQVSAEAKRCLGCGVSVVDEHMCIGCGQCVTRCKFEAIKLEKVRDKPTITADELIATPQNFVVKHFGPRV